MSSVASMFNRIPADLRVPLFYAEIDSSQAGYFTQALRSLLIGQKLVAGSATAGQPYLVATIDQAKTLFGVGSMLARMFEVYRLNDPTGEVWCIALADAGGGANAAGSIVVTGPATAAGTIALYIAGQRLTVGVAASATADTIAAAINAAINAAIDLPVTSTVSTNTVTITCRWKGTTGNDIAITQNYRGSLGGESTPAGVSLAITALSAGATDPALTAAITAMGDEEYDFIALPYADTTSLDLMQTEMNDIAGRWSYARQIYGHVYAAKRNTFSNLRDLGAARNDPHMSIAGFEPGVPTPVWEYAAAYCARNAVFIGNHPARPTQSGELIGVLPALPGTRFVFAERQTLLKNGIATSYVAGGLQRVERAISTYQKNSWAQLDPSMLDSETQHTNATMLRRLRSVTTGKYPRSGLRRDGTRFSGDAAIVTPSVYRGELVAEYYRMEADGIAENAAAFEEHLIVEINANNPNRLDVLFPPDHVNQLRIVAILNQFRLNYPKAA